MVAVRLVQHSPPSRVVCARQRRASYGSDGGCRQYQDVYRRFPRKTTLATPIAQAQDTIYGNIPTGLFPIVHRAKSLYNAGVDEQVTVVQSLAVL